MATLKELHELVQSLDKNEKKYVSLMMEAVGGKARERYQRAFKILSKQIEFDDEKLKQKLRTDISGMTLSEANSYVYDFICKAIVSYQTGETLSYSNQLKLIEIMISKKLLDNAHKLLQKLIPDLENDGTYAQLHRAHELLELITIQHPRVNADYTYRAGFLKSRMDAAVSFQQHVELCNMQFLFYKTIKEYGQARTKEQLKPYQQLWNNPLLKLQPHQVDSRSIVPYYVLRTGISAALYMPEAYDYCRDCIRDFTTRFAGKALENREINLYDTLLTLMITRDSIDYTELQQAKQRMLQLIKMVPRKGTRQHRYAKIVMAELAYYIKAKLYKQGIAHFEEAMKPAEQEKWMDAILSYAIPWMGARLYYLDKNYSRALDCLLQIQQHEKTMRPHVFIDYKFLLLLCYYHTSQHSLVTSTADSLYKRLLKQEKLYAPERALLRFVKSSGTIPKMKENIRQLHETFTELKKDPFNQPFFLYGDHMEWLETEMSGARK